MWENELLLQGHSHGVPQDKQEQRTAWVGALPSAWVTHCGAPGTWWSLWVTSPWGTNYFIPYGDQRFIAGIMRTGDFQSN